jgi:DNA-binding response OmpR family regulator
MVTCPVCGSKVHSITIRFADEDAYYNGQRLWLTPVELKVLKQLWDDEFLDSLTNGWARVTSAATIVSRLRVKLGRVGAPFAIQTIRKKGYVLQPLPEKPTFK